MNTEYLNSLKQLIDRIEPAWVSDHLCWTGVNCKNMHDLLPLPYTEEAITHLANRIKVVQDFLGRQMAFENVSSYLSFNHSEMQEWEFLTEVSRRADCLLLLDINNIFVSSVNQDFPAKAFLDGIPKDKVIQFHIAGHSKNGEQLIDTHDYPVCDEVWSLLRHAYERFGPISTLLERDDNIPEFSELEYELCRARSARSFLGDSSHVEPKTS